MSGARAPLTDEAFVDRAAQLLRNPSLAIDSGDIDFLVRVSELIRRGIPLSEQQHSTLSRIVNQLDHDPITDYAWQRIKEEPCV